MIFLVSHENFFNLQIFDMFSYSKKNKIILFLISICKRFEQVSNFIKLGKISLPYVDTLKELFFSLFVILVDNFYFFILNSQFNVLSAALLVTVRTQLIGNIVKLTFKLDSKLNA